MADIGYVFITSQEYKDLILKTKQLEETENLYKEKDEQLFHANETIADKTKEIEDLLKVLVKNQKIYDKLDSYNIALDREIAKYLNEHYLKQIKEFCEEVE